MPRNLLLPWLIYTCAFCFLQLESERPHPQILDIPASPASVSALVRLCCALAELKSARSGRRGLATASTLGCSQGLFQPSHRPVLRPGLSVFARRYRASAAFPCTELLQAGAPARSSRFSLLQRPLLEESRLARRRCSVRGRAVRLPKKDSRGRVGNSGPLLQGHEERRCRYNCSNGMHVLPSQHSRT